jgi:hypothetical protein
MRAALGAPTISTPVRLRRSSADALKPVAVNFGHGGAEALENWIAEHRGRHTPDTIAHADRQGRGAGLFNGADSVNSASLRNAK